LVVLAYLIYAVFESWTYLRFLLPALAVAVIALSSMLMWGSARLPVVARVFVIPIVLLSVCATNVASARELGVFRFADRQTRGRVVGERLASLLPPDAVIVSSEQSGTMRYYTGRSVLRWDLVTPSAMPSALARLADAGHSLWVVLDDWEEADFRRKFPELASRTLDHQPVVESAPGLGIRTRAWPVR
jgi:hypothetical protein